MKLRRHRRKGQAIVEYIIIIASTFGDNKAAAEVDNNKSADILKNMDKDGIDISGE